MDRKDEAHRVHVLSAAMYYSLALSVRTGERLFWRELQLRGKMCVIPYLKQRERC